MVVEDVVRCDEAGEEVGEFELGAIFVVSGGHFGDSSTFEVLTCSVYMALMVGKEGRIWRWTLGSLMYDDLIRDRICQANKQADLP